MSDLEEEPDREEYFSNEPLQANAYRVEEWANEDLIELLRADNKHSFWKELVEARQPENINYKAWRDNCLNYLIDSYIYYRRHYDHTHKRVVPKPVAVAMAYRDSIEYMYCSPTKGRLKTRVMLERGW